MVPVKTKSDKIRKIMEKIAIVSVVSAMLNYTVSQKVPTSNCL